MHNPAKQLEAIKSIEITLTDKDRGIFTISNLPWGFISSVLTSCSLYSYMRSRTSKINLIEANPGTYEQESAIENFAYNEALHKQVQWFEKSLRVPLFNDQMNEFYQLDQAKFNADIQQRLETYANREQDREQGLVIPTIQPNKLTGWKNHLAWVKLLVIESVESLTHANQAATGLLADNHHNRIESILETANKLEKIAIEMRERAQAADELIKAEQAAAQSRRTEHTTEENKYSDVFTW